MTRHRGLVLRSVLVGVLTLLSRLLGFVRETLTALVFGDSSAISDAFFSAWRVPNLFRRLFGEGALSMSLQTALTEEDADRGDEAGRALFLRAVALSSSILIALCAIAMALVAWMPDRMPWTGWAWLGADPAPVRDLTVRMLPFVMLVCVTALCGGALAVRGHFALPNLAPTVMNLAWIGTLVWVGTRYGWEQSGRGEGGEVFERQWRMSREIAWGLLLGGLLQLVLHVPPLLRTGLLGRAPRAAADLSRRALAILWTSAPLAVGAAAFQINVLTGALMAEALLSDGGPTALYYANRVQELPLALVAVATTSAVFPALTALGHRRRLADLRKLHDDAQHAIVFLALPASVGLWVLAEPIASALFLHGNYGLEGVRRIAAGLRWLAVALIPAGATGLVSRVYYSLGDRRTPVRVALVLVVANALLVLCFVTGLGMDVGGLTLAAALCAWANLGALLFLLPRWHALPSSEGGNARRLLTTALASLASGLSAWLVQRVAVRAGLGSVGSVCVAVPVGCIVYLACARALRVGELESLRQRLERRASGA